MSYRKTCTKYANNHFNIETLNYFIEFGSTVLVHLQNHCLMDIVSKAQSCGLLHLAIVSFR